MASKLTSRLFELTRLVSSCQTSTSASSCSGRFTVKHDRQNHRFTITAGSGEGADDCAVLKYKFTGQKEVDLMSTFVPETFRGQGIAAVLSKAAMDFLVEENLKAHVSCWYIKKYIDEQPQQQYKDYIIP
ncbi:PREDICTED: protein NATD1-like [Cyprinodon variegatus]|uniref:Protein NATD1 n=1 Tax=Cyprinodon variegatus TaxID=28743 RepID=A0A3Q2G7Z1_CYPVA|nr:PREDICTED: protein NATD1-like [Cyprinodon variegatus]